MGIVIEPESSLPVDPPATRTTRSAVPVRRRTSGATSETVWQRESSSSLRRRVRRPRSTRRRPSTTRASRRWSDTRLQTAAPAIHTTSPTTTNATHAITVTVSDRVSTSLPRLTMPSSPKNLLAWPAIQPRASAGKASRRPVIPAKASCRFESLISGGGSGASAGPSAVGGSPSAGGVSPRRPAESIWATGRESPDREISLSPMPAPVSTRSRQRPKARSTGGWTISTSWARPSGIRRCSRRMTPRCSQNAPSARHQRVDDQRTKLGMRASRPMTTAPITSRVSPPHATATRNPTPWPSMGRIVTGLIRCHGRSGRSPDGSGGIALAYPGEHDGAHPVRLVGFDPRDGP